MRRLSILTLAALTVLIAPAPSSAHAQTGAYDITACNDAEGTNNSWIWSTNDAHYAEHTHCPYRLGGNGGLTDQEGGLSTTDELGLTNGAPPGASANWTFTAPTGTTITGITYERYLGHIFDSSNFWSPALRADGTIIPGETCLDTIENNENCFIGGPPGEGGEPGEVSGLSAHQLALGILCQAHAEEECITGATEHKAWAAMYGATVTLSDPSPPTLTTPTGALWEPGKTNGYHKGTETVITTAQDTGGGVQSIILASDGSPVNTYDASCDYTLPQPCPSSTEQTLTLPTTDLLDGTHTLALYTIDAADNESPVASAQVTVDNNPPPPPTELTATATQPGGSTFTVTWTNPPAQVAPITLATYQICAVTSPDTCSPPTAAAPNEPATITVPGPGQWYFNLWLSDAAGNSNPANAGHATLIVPTSKPPSDVGGASSSSRSSSNDTPGTPGSPGNSGSGSGNAIPKTRLHLSETLHGRNLIVHVSGPTTGRVRLRFTGRLHNRTVATGSKTAILKHRGLTISFTLGPRTAASAKILVSAALDHGVTVTSTLQRRALPHNGQDGQ